MLSTVLYLTLSFFREYILSQIREHEYLYGWPSSPVDLNTWNKFVHMHKSLQSEKKLLW